MDRDKLRAQLQPEEGKRNLMYWDPIGKVWTIGIGHNLKFPISDAAVVQIFNDDTDTLETGIATVVPGWATLDDPRQRVFADMVFEMGLDGLAEFHDMLRFAGLRDWANAAAAGLDSEWAKVQVPSRAQHLMDCLLTGADPLTA